MELDLVPGGDEAALAAARLAAAAARVDDEATARRTRWWRAGLEDAIAAREIPPAPTSAGGSRTVARYAAPSPRSTRGATRA